MDADRAMELIRKISYKPGYRITAERELFALVDPAWVAYPERRRQRAAAGVKVQMSWEAPDSSVPPDYRATTTVFNQLMISAETLMMMETDSDFYRYLLAWILKAETHEAREFFKIKDPVPWNPYDTEFETPFDPHRATGTDLWEATRRWGQIR